MDGRALCYPASVQVALIHEWHRDGVNRNAPLRWPGPTGRCHSCVERGLPILAKDPPQGRHFPGEHSPFEVIPGAKVIRPLLLLHCPSSSLGALPYASHNGMLVFRRAVLFDQLHLACFDLILHVLVAVVPDLIP
jgi:hypothetical protein